MLESSQYLPSLLFPGFIKLGSESLSEDSTLNDWIVNQTDKFFQNLPSTKTHDEKKRSTSDPLPFSSKEKQGHLSKKIVHTVSGQKSSPFRSLKSSASCPRINETSIEISHPTQGKATVQKFLKFEDINSNLVSLLPLEYEEPLRLVIEAFKRDMVSSVYHLNDECLLEICADCASNSGEKGLEHEILANAFDKLKAKFKPQAFENLTCLMHQGITRDIISYVYEKIQLLTSNNKPISFEILECENEVAIIVNMNLILTNLVSMETENLLMRRTIIIPTDELEQDWKNSNDLESIAPNTRVIDEYLTCLHLGL